MEVIATVYKKPYYHDRNQRMIDAGVDLFRIKCSHWGLAEIAATLKTCRDHITASGKPVKLLADLPEAKIRLGSFPQSKVQVPKDKTFAFRLAQTSPDPEQFIPHTFPGLATHLKPGDVFYVGDGQLGMRVTSVIDADTFTAETVNGSRLIECTALTIPAIADTLDHVAPFIDEIISILPESKPDIVAFSFVSSRQMLEALIAKLIPFTSSEWRPTIIAKIESQGGVDNIDEILEVANGIMVARGDLALNVPFQRLGLIQKMLVAKARRAGKYVIVSTGMLQSLLDNYLPMRSDILDVTNAALDGANAIMLCPETAHSETPERAVTVAKQIIAEVERSRES